MNPKKQTRCPKCGTIYNIGIYQLSIAKGWAYCTDCSLSFNALEHLYQATEQDRQYTSIIQQKLQHNDIALFLNQKVEHHHINLLEYLDGLDYHSQRQTQNEFSTHHHHKKKRSFLQEYGLFLIFLVLSGVVMILQHSGKITLFVDH